MLARLALALFGIAVALVLVEGGFRLADRVRCFDDNANSFWEPSPRYGWGHAHGASGWAKRCWGSKTEWATYVRINRLGLRDRDIPYERSGAYRILVLGDSFTEGLQVDEEETFVKQLERRLNGDDPGGPRVEVINAGHAGFGTDNELLFYRDEGRRYRPDLVLLVFNTENDVFESYHPLQSGSPLYPPKPYFLFAGGRLVLHDFPLPQPSRRARLTASVRGAFLRRSMAIRWLNTLRFPRVVQPAHAALPERQPPGPLGALLEIYPPEWEEAWRVTRALVRRLRRAVERDGSRFAVVIISGGHEVSERKLRTRLFFIRQPRDLFDQDKAYRLAIRFFRRERIPCVTLLPSFREHFRRTGREGYYQWDPHWNAEGHALAAELIERGLAELGLLPPP